MVDFQCKERYDYPDLLEIMRLLRGPGGCPWDAEQTHESIRRSFLEEAYEAVDAIDRADRTALCEELGDVLLQVVFHAELEREQGGFTMDDVVDGICRKLIYRHPHVFGTVRAENSEQVLTNWEALKRAEKGQATTADAVDAVADEDPEDVWELLVTAWEEAAEPHPASIMAAESAIAIHTCFFFIFPP